jgi:hypothetical protein
MQQSSTEQPVRAPRVRFGVDLQATKAEYRQALWGFRAVVAPAQPQDMRPLAHAEEAQHAPA